MSTIYNRKSSVSIRSFVPERCWKNWHLPGCRDGGVKRKQSERNIYIPSLEASSGHSHESSENRTTFSIFRSFSEIGHFGERFSFFAGKVLPSYDARGKVIYESANVTPQSFSVTELRILLFRLLTVLPWPLVGKSFLPSSEMSARVVQNPRVPFHIFQNLVTNAYVCHWDTVTNGILLAYADS